MSLIHPGILTAGRRHGARRINVFDGSPLQTVLHADVGTLDPVSSGFTQPFVQSVPVPVGTSVPQGTYGVRIGAEQLAVQAKSVKHRPNGDANILRVEGVWPAHLTGPQTISLTALPPAVPPDVTVEVSGGAALIKVNGVTKHTITPYAATKVISGSKPSNLKGSNTDPAYVPSIAFHEWHITVGGSATSVGAGYVSITIEEDTPALRVYKAIGNGSANDLYEFQTRFIVYKAEAYIRFEHTTFKHFDVNTPDAPTSPSSMDALAAERWTITPAAPFTNATVRSTTAASLTLEASPFGAVTGAIAGSGTEEDLNAVRLTGPAPLTVAVVDLMSAGPSAIRATTSSLVVDFWSEHTGEALDSRGTGASGEVQGDTSDYNSKPRGHARTWEGLLVLGDDLPLAQAFAQRDDLWLPTPAAVAASDAWGPLDIGGATQFSDVARRIHALARNHSQAVERHSHYGYVNRHLLPQYIPRAVDTALDMYVADEPMKSGRYGQHKSTGTGWLEMHLYTGDRTRFLRGLRMLQHVQDIAGVHRRLLGADYAGSDKDGYHRRYRDPFTGKANDTQYWLPYVPYKTYWAGGSRRILERAQNYAESLHAKGTSPYPQRIWSNAVRYQHSHDPSDLAALNDSLASDPVSANNTWPPPASLTGKVAGMFWGNFRWAGDTCSTLMEVYGATGDAQLLTDLATAYAEQDWSGATEPIAAFGNLTGAYRAMVWLALHGVSPGANPLNMLNTRFRPKWDSGDLAYHNAALPAGDPDTYTWEQIQTYSGTQTEESPVSEQGSFALIASYLHVTT